MTWIFWAVWVSATIAVWVLPKPERFAVAVLGDIAFIALQVLWAHEPVGVAVGVLLLVYSLWQWWNNRKDRRRARELLGAKAKALRDTLVRRLGERAVPGKPLPARQ
jgi:Flp pilus assembly protein TadB